MRIRTDPMVVYGRVRAASQESAVETLGLIQRKLRALPLATGELAASYRLETLREDSDSVEMILVSDASHAAVIERGGWIRGGRGPHVSGSGKGRHILRDTARRDWGRRMAKALRA